MAIEITGRNVEVTDSMREYAEKRFGKLVQEFPRVDKIHVILDIQKFTHTAEVVVHARRHIVLEAKESSDNMYASIDLVLEKMERQLHKSIDKREEHKGQESIADLEAKQD